MSKKYVRPAEYIVPLNINGLEGRMLNLGGRNKNNRSELMLVYDLNSNLERWWGLVVALSRYGNVTMADLPGFGGMDSFYTIGSKPTIDNLADYLASFVKLRYRRKKLSIVAIGFGFCVVTRMLQRNPELKSKVSLVACINGYAHKDDFIPSGPNQRLKTISYRVGASLLIINILKLVMNNPVALNLRFRPAVSSNNIRKIADEQFITKFRIDLAKENDLRTKIYLAWELLNLDNCDRSVALPLWHITLGHPREVNPKLVEQHLRVIFRDYTHLPSKLIRTLPLVLNDEKMAIKFIPARLRRELKKPANGNKP